MLDKTKSALKLCLLNNPRLFDLVTSILGRSNLETRLMLKMLQKGDTVFDIGANTGQYSQILCTIIGRDGSYHAFEPIPDSFNALTRNVSRYRHSCQIYLHRVALSNSSVEMPMFIPNNDLTGASLVQHSQHWPAAPGKVHPLVTSIEKVPTTTLDHFCSKNNIAANLSFIKCDVEGAELLVMKGASETLRRYRPILLLECYPPWTADYEYHPQDLWRFLHQLAGYQIWHIGEKSIREIRDWNSPLPGIYPNSLNYLCTIPEVHTERMSKLGMLACYH